MKTILKLLCATALAWAVPVAAAWASTLDDLTLEDQPKKIIARLVFSEPVSAEVVSHYTNNFVALNIEGLELTRSQQGKKYTPPGDNAQFLKHVVLQGDDGSAQIRFYLGGLATPADAQVVPLDATIVVEIIKPLWKLDAADAAVGVGDPGAGATEPEAGGNEPPADGFIPDDGDEPADGAEPANGGTAEDGGEAPPADGGEAPPEDSGEAPPVEGGTFGDAPGGDTGAPAPDDATVPPADGFTAGPAYTAFDLDRVPVNQLDIRGMPFDEALVELVAGTGFNVVVGPGIDDAEVNLSFTQKDISLKSALDLLCFAYDLAYTVEDDAIVFSAK